MTGMAADRRGMALVLAGALCFSTSGLTQALAPEGATPFIIGALRMLVGGAALFAWCLWRGILPKKFPRPIPNLIGAALGLLGCQLFFFKGTLLVGVAVGTVMMIGITPILSAVLARVLLNERPARVWYPATFLAVVGLLLLKGLGEGARDTADLLWPVAASFSYALYLVSGKSLTRRRLPGQTAEGVMMTLCLLCGAVMLPLFFFYPTAWLASPQGVLAALNLGVTTSAMAFTLTLAGLRLIPTAAVSTLGMAEPLGAALFGYFFLNEPLTGASLLAFACFFLSMLLLIFFSPRPPAAYGSAPKPDAA